MTAVKGEETKDAITVLHLDLWKDEDLPDIARQIREIIARGIDSDTPKAAMETANQLDALCPPHDQASDSQDPENYMWNIWHIIMDIAGSHDVTLKMQGGIIRTIQAFQQIEERHLNSGHKLSGETRKRGWMDPSSFSICFYDSFDDPTISSAELPPSTKSLQAWRNINRFGASFSGSGLWTPYKQAMHAFSIGLENEPSRVAEAAECQLIVACDWMARNADFFFSWALENVGCQVYPRENAMGDDYAAYIPPKDAAPLWDGGALYDGPQCVCLQRWAFWIKRFEELGKTEESSLSSEARSEASKTVEIMRTAERRFGHLVEPGTN